jgi:hypothetical protein
VESSYETELVPPADPFLWSLNESTREYLVVNSVIQKENADFSKSKRQYGDFCRSFTPTMFYREMCNGERVRRCWLIYSESQGKVFCGVCRLFGSQVSALSCEGFNDWKHAKERLAEHENSDHHRSAALTLLRRSQAKSIKCHLVSQMESEVSYWRKVLTRVVEVVKSLTSRGLPFRGTSETFNDPHNGNYMMTLQLVAKFDVFLSEHIARYGNCGSGSTSYLSFATCDEFIDLLARKVREKIVAELKEAKYFSFSVDSTPDITHNDQLSFAVRYVGRNGTPYERFLTFLQNVGHKSEDMAIAVFDILKTFGVDIHDCRGQSYDNAANMAGRYSGLQARVKDVNPFARFVPCAGHSLNLVGQSAAEACSEAVSFFAFIQNLYNFFTNSTHRHAILQKTFDDSNNDSTKTLKSLSITRWSARDDACSALNCGWEETQDALKLIVDDMTEKPLVRNEAEGLLRQFHSLETAFMTTLWSLLLHRFKAASVRLQAVDIDLNTVVELYESLIELVKTCRNDFDLFEKKATEKGPTQYKHEKSRMTKRKRHQDEMSDPAEVPFSPREKFRFNTFLAILDSLNVQLQQRCEAYIYLNKHFGFLIRISTMTSADISSSIVSLSEELPNDFDRDSLTKECIHFAAHLRSQDNEWGPKTAADMMKMIRENLFTEVYPNLEITLRIYLCLMATNCCTERSFSGLKRIKNYLRSSLSQDKMTSMSLLCIESSILETLDCDTIINDFSVVKARRKPI